MTTRHCQLCSRGSTDRSPRARLLGHLPSLLGWGGDGKRLVAHFAFQVSKSPDAVCRTPLQGDVRAGEGLPGLAPSTLGAHPSSSHPGPAGWARAASASLWVATFTLQGEQSQGEEKEVGARRKKISANGQAPKSPQWLRSLSATQRFQELHPCTTSEPPSWSLRWVEPKEAEPRSLTTGPSDCKALNSYYTAHSLLPSPRCPDAQPRPRAKGQSCPPAAGSPEQLPLRPGLKLGRGRSAPPAGSSESAAHAGRNRRPARMLRTRAALLRTVLGLEHILQT